MARLARADLVDPNEVATFHCIHRCVRRSYLCGADPYTGRNYDHRKAWIEQRIEWLSRYFGIDVVGYSIMSNHFHLILRSRPDVVSAWDSTEVARRWWMLCPARKDAEGTPEEPNEAELDTIRNQPERLAEIRTRLSDISWWMRMIAEPVARRANREEQLTGRFWEGRYKCIKLCDEAALLACLAYVDLNPVRAGIAQSPETSEYTSVRRRIEASARPHRDACLAPLELSESNTGPMCSWSSHRASDKGCVPLSVAEYLELLDWTGRQLARGKRGKIPAHLAPILQRTGIPPTCWVEVVGKFGKSFHRVAGRWQSVAGQVPRTGHTARFRPGRADLLEAA
jgi:REP element-mobilizing transposase RayT